MLTPELTHAYHFSQSQAEVEETLEGNNLRHDKKRVPYLYSQWQLDNVSDVWNQPALALEAAGQWCLHPVHYTSSLWLDVK